MQTIQGWYGKIWLREGLLQRKQEQKTGKGWFESWLNDSPWLTTLICTLSGLLIILLILLTFRPIILNKLVTFIEERISTVQLLVSQTAICVAS